MPLAHTEKVSPQYCCYKAEVVTAVTHIAPGRVILLPLPQIAFPLLCRFIPTRKWLSSEIYVFFQAKAITEEDELTVKRWFSGKIHSLI